MNRKKNIIIAITGASGSVYARMLCTRLSATEGLGEIAVITTRNGASVMEFEDQTDWLSDGRFTRYDNGTLFCPPASGSASYDAMVIIPCSMGMAGRIANGISDDLISRAADVMLKERRRLILVPREAPLNTIHLRNLTSLSECGAVICPASPSFYSKPKDTDELCSTIIERIFALLEIDTLHYSWSGN